MRCKLSPAFKDGSAFADQGWVVWSSSMKLVLYSSSPYVPSSKLKTTDKQSRSRVYRVELHCTLLLYVGTKPPLSVCIGGWLDGRAAS